MRSLRNRRQALSDAGEMRQPVCSARALATTVMLVSAVLLSGCAGGDGLVADSEKLAPSFKALVEQRLAQGEHSDWDRAAMEKAIQTGKITEADYADGADLYETCIKEAGLAFTRTTLLNGVIEFQPPAGASSSADWEAEGLIQHECEQATYAHTQELFRMQQANPELLGDFSLALVNCLKESGVVGEDFTAKDLNATILTADLPSDGYSYDVTDSRAHTCLYSLGFVILVDSD